MDCVTRYVVTHLNEHGQRVLAHAQQVRNTYGTEKEAQEWIDAALKENGEEGLRSFYGFPLEVRPVLCWPGHFDPTTCYFD